MSSSFKGLTINDTGYLQLPNGTAANRPSLFSSTAIQWTNTGSQSYSVIAGSAGTLTNTSWTCPTGVTSIEVLVVAGGGGGGSTYHAGGGGAGGLIYNSAYTVVPGTVYTVTVGAGGAGGAVGLPGAVGSNGSNSVFGSLVAIGGGGGASYGANTSPGTGGSGGGGSQIQSAGWINYIGAPGIAGQGNFGGNSAYGYDNSWMGAGGGGGAGGPGFAGSNFPDVTAGGTGGNGGVGLVFSISGTPTYYAGGGGGSGGTTAGIGGLGGGGNGGNAQGTGLGQPTAGTPSTGGGGGGAERSSSSSPVAYAGGAGGSGIVILRYALADSNTLAAGQTRFNTNLGITETFNSNNQWSPQTTGEKIVTNGLIMNLDASRYNTASTTTWFDQTSNGNNGTLTNSPAYTPNYGGGFVFNGSNTYVALPNGLLQGTGDFTVSMWVQPSAGGSNTLFASYPSSNLQLFYNSGTTGTYIADASAYYSNQYGDYNITSPTLVTTLRRGSRVEVYINGVFKKYGTTSASLGSAGTVFRIGANTSGGEQFTGTVYVCLVYNRALTAQEITQNYQAQTPRFKKGKKQTLAGWRSVGSGTFSNANLVWSTEQGTRTGYSSTCWNEAFVGDFTLVCFWRHDYIGMGVQYGPDVFVEGFTGYSADATGPYGGSSNTSGFASGYQGTYYGQYHAPITGQGASTPYPGYWFKWQRAGNLVTMQYSTTSGYGPWTNNNSANAVTVSSNDRVICVIGEASGTEYYPLTFVSLTYNN
jgi:hypothetical protein